MRYYLGKKLCAFTFANARLNLMPEDFKELKIILPREEIMLSLTEVTSRGPPSNINSEKRKLEAVVSSDIAYAFSISAVSRWNHC